jgi:hypothetical protein
MLPMTLRNRLSAFELTQPTAFAGAGAAIRLSFRRAGLLTYTNTFPHESAKKKNTHTKDQELGSVDQLQLAEICLWVCMRSALILACILRHNWPCLALCMRSSCQWEASTHTKHYHTMQKQHCYSTQASRQLRAP